MRPLLIAASAAALLSAAAAHAEITVHQAEYFDGVLHVSGETSVPKREIRLDGRYSETADDVGVFGFRVPYLPDDCTISLSDGEDTRTAYVRGCSGSRAVDLDDKREGRQRKPE